MGSIGAEVVFGPKPLKAAKLLALAVLVLVGAGASFLSGIHGLAQAKGVMTELFAVSALKIVFGLVAAGLIALAAFIQFRGAATGHPRLVLSARTVRFGMMRRSIEVPWEAVSEFTLQGPRQYGLIQAEIVDPNPLTGRRKIKYFRIPGRLLDVSPEDLVEELNDWRTGRASRLGPSGAVATQSAQSRQNIEPWQIG